MLNTASFKRTAEHGRDARLARPPRMAKRTSRTPRRCVPIALFWALVISLSLLGFLPVSAETPRVAVHLLDHIGKQKTKTRCWIDWSNQWRGIVSTKEVSGEDAGKIIRQLSESLKNAEAAHFCGHDPIYGIEATNAEGKSLKTSLCFTCLTWVKPGLRLNIDGERGANNPLCKALREVIELPSELLEDAKTTNTND